jgi:7-carboxy-7-deazaguanine synthase|tara:strand:+ start:963 stop:1721 length:759 start_codon:yes stop_codon:yes gene_type:complete
MSIDCDKETLLISDDKAFYTLEGEGEYVGMPSVFFRLSMCNLTCEGFASEDSPHGCDSFISWSVKNKMTFNEIFEYFEKHKLIDKLRNGAIFKITGGEPMVQQKGLLKFMEAFVKKYEFGPIIDFETNATIMPDEKWLQLYRATFTTSPKLTTNGDPEKKTYKPKVLKWHKEAGSGFKFVINASEDIDEIWRKYVDDNEINIPKNRIWFMPCSGSRQEHVENAPAVAEYAKAMNVNFSPRLHLLIWDMALKV